MLLHIYSIKRSKFTSAIFLALNLITAVSLYAQSEQQQPGHVLNETVQHLIDSAVESNSSRGPVYVGLEVTFGVPQFHIESNIQKLDEVHASFFGSRVGGIIGNHRGKLKSTFGLYYSDDNTPYTFDMKRTSLAATVYVLRTGREIKYHTIEPYLVVGASGQVINFYGSYLSSGPKHVSRGEEPLLGKMHSAMVMTGAGFEFQLESDTNRFIHLFTEITLRHVVKAHADETFSNTRASGPVVLTFGVNFGAIKR